MSSTNYLRVLKNVKCNKCGFETTDDKFEHIDIKKTGYNSFTSETRMECPKCNGVNDFTYLDEWGDPQEQEIIILDDEDDDYWKDEKES